MLLIPNTYQGLLLLSKILITIVVIDKQIETCFCFCFRRPVLRLSSVQSNVIYPEYFVNPFSITSTTIIFSPINRRGLWKCTNPIRIADISSLNNNNCCHNMVLHAKRISSSTTDNELQQITSTKNSSKIPKRKQSFKKINEIPYWKQENDQISATIRNNEINSENDFGKPADFLKLLSNGKFSKLFFTVRGNPQPLRRHRTRGGFMYNPSAPAQEAFRSIVRYYLQTLENTIPEAQMISPILNIEKQSTVIVDDHDKNPTIINDRKTNKPNFLPNQQLAMTIVFKMKRPQNHFVSSKRGPGRLRKQYNTTHLLLDDNSMDMYPTTSSDVDNLAKFVLDSLNDIVYADDRQVVSLHAIKIYDSLCSDADSCCLGSTDVCIRSIDSPAELNRMIIEAMQ